MSNAIAVRASQLEDFELDQRRAKAYAESGYWPDTKSIAQALVKIEAGRSLGITPFLAMSEINFINQKPNVGSGALAALVQSHPKYDYTIIEHDDTVCRIRFYKLGEIAGPDSVFTIEDAKKAGLDKRNPTYHQYPRNMLFARAMSNGVAWHCPEVTLGRIYVPEDFEELGGVPGADGARSVAQPQPGPAVSVEGTPAPPNPDPGGPTPDSPAASEGVPETTASGDEARPDKPSQRSRRKLDATFNEMRNAGQITVAQAAELAGIPPTLTTSPAGEPSWSHLRLLLKTQQQVNDLISELGYWSYQHPPADSPDRGEAQFEIPEAAKK